MLFIYKGNDTVCTKEPELFTVELWNPWKRRNNLCLGKPTLPLNKVLEHFQEQQFQSHSSPSTLAMSRSKQLATWTPPPEHWYKINFDGFTFANKDKAGLGVVVRNSEGLVMVSLAQQIPLPPSVTEVEVLVARRALELAIELSFDRIILEGDSKILDKAMKTKCCNLAPYGHIVQDVLFLSKHFLDFKTSLSTTVEVEVEPMMEDNELNHLTRKRKKKSLNQKSMAGVNDGGVRAGEKWRWRWRSVTPT
ncbi:hypothetical protein SO802_001692 [Lithocarpus litseifolius]|uniref:RNase H type-1 domain-containing protein n=1 Tax=Lithocarpus litseifolius TaxID=425828 RepID=A0AAW2DYN5_9ROSI